MRTAQSTTRELVTTLLDELAAGSPGAVARACAPAVTWWVPLGAVDHVGAGPVEQALLACIGAPAGRVERRSLVVAEDGSSAVVEQTVLRSPGSTPTPVTSVLTLADGRVTEGRTYVDVAAWRDGGEAAPDGDS